jgi:hypothetical protein
MPSDIHQRNDVVTSVERSGNVISDIRKLKDVVTSAERREG